MPKKMITLDLCRSGQLVIWQKEAGDRCREILKAYDLGQSLNQEHAEFALALLERHPDRERKEGCGVADIFVDRDAYGGRCFWIKRVDGTKDDFSWPKCVSGKAESVAAEFKRTARDEIAPQVLAFKNAFFASEEPRICPIDGTTFTSDTSHVDHKPPATFDKLLSEFVKSFGVIVEACEFRQDAGKARAFADRHLAEAWTQYHAKHAILRVTSAQGNLRQARGDK